MSSHDERVVEMRFDNAQFEKGIKESVKSLDELSRKLKLDKAAESLTNLERQASKFSLKSVSTAVSDGIKEFGALGIAGVAAITSITNAAINAGTQLASGFIRPMRMGLSEYETQIGAVQTILSNTSSKGTTIDQVNDALNELNKYADLTIYNFTQMTDNIGRFTAAGVGLEDSVTAIKGISNLAAVSGSDATQAARAMYNLSQALSMGSLKLMDWNSVVNAGMGGEIFQESLKETARVHGIAVDEIIKKHGSFRESLSEDWISSAILLETLQKFTGDLSAEQLRNIGYTEDQITAIEKLGKDANDAATKVKTFTQLMDTLDEEKQSGWTQSWQILIGDFEEAREFWSQVSSIMTSMVSETAQKRNDFLEAIFGSPEKSNSISYDRWMKFAGSGNLPDGFRQALIDNAREQGVAIDEIMEKYKEFGDLAFEESIKSGWLTTGMVRDVIEGNSQMSKSFDELKQVVNEVEEGVYGNADTGRYEKLREAGWDPELVQQLVNLDVYGQLDWNNLTEEQLRNLGVTEEQIVAFKELKEQLADPDSAINYLLEQDTPKSGREYLIEGIINLLQAGTDAMRLFGQVWDEVFPVVDASNIVGALASFSAFTQQLLIFTRDEEGNITGMTAFGSKLKVIFTGIADAVGILTDILGAAGEVFSWVFDKIFGHMPKLDGNDLINAIARMAFSITNLRKSLKQSNAMGKAVNAITNALSRFGEVAKSAFEALKSILSGGQVDWSFLDKIKAKIDAIRNAIGRFSLSNTLGKFRTFLSSKGFKVDWLDKLISKLGNNTFGKVVTSATEKFEHLKTVLSSAKDGAFKSVKDFFGSFNLDIPASIQGVIDRVRNFFGGLSFDTNPFEVLRSKINDVVAFFSSIDLPDNFDPIGSVASAFSLAKSTLSNIDWPEDFNPIANIQAVWESITTFFTNTIQKVDLQPVIDAADSIATAATTLGQADVDEDFDPIENIKTAVSNIVSWAENVKIDFSPIEDLQSKFDQFKDWLGGFDSIEFDTNPLDNVLENIKVSVGHFTSSPVMTELFDALRQLKSILVLIVTGYAGTKVLRFFTDISDGLKTMIGAGGNQGDNYADKAIKIAEAIGILALSAKLMSTIDSEKVGVVISGMVTSVAALMATLGGGAGINSKLNGAMSKIRSSALLAAAGAIKILADTVIDISESGITESQALMAGGVIEALGAVLTASVGLLSGVSYETTKTDGKTGSTIARQFKSGAAGAGIGVAMIGASIAIKQLFKLVGKVIDAGYSTEDIAKAEAVIASLSVLLGTTGKFMTSYKKNVTTSGSGGAKGVFNKSKSVERGSFGVSQGAGMTLYVKAIEDALELIEPTKAYSVEEIALASFKIALLAGVVGGIGVLLSKLLILRDAGGTRSFLGASGTSLLLKSAASSLGDIAEASVKLSDADLDGTAAAMDVFGESAKSLIGILTAATVATIFIPNLWKITAAVGVIALGIGIAAEGVGMFAQAMSDMIDKVSDNDMSVDDIANFASDITSGMITGATSDEAMEGYAKVVDAILDGLTEAAWGIATFKLNIGLAIIHIICSSILQAVGASEADLEFEQTMYEVVDEFFHNPIKAVEDGRLVEAMVEFGKRLAQAVIIAFHDSPVLRAWWDSIAYSLNTLFGEGTMFYMEDVEVGIDGSVLLTPEGNVMVNTRRLEEDIDSAIGGFDIAGLPFQHESTLEYDPNVNIDASGAIVTLSVDSPYFTMDEEGWYDELNDRVFDVDGTAVKVKPTTLELIVPTSDTRYDVYDENGKALSDQSISVLKGNLTYLKDAEILGNEFTQGFVNGLGADVDLGHIADVTIVAPVVAGVREAQKSGSPSRVAEGLGGDFTDGYAIGLNKGGATINVAITNMFSAIQVVMHAQESSFDQYGLTMVERIAAGIANGQSLPASRMLSVMDSLVNSLNGRYWAFYDAGRACVQGFANGISAQASSAINAAAEMATNALNTAKNKLGVASPSKEFHRIGEFSAQGFGNGMLESINYVADSATAMGQAALGNMRTTARLLNAIVEDEFNNEIILTPVVDLTSLRNASELMSGISTTSRLAIHAGAASASRIDPLNRLVDSMENSSQAFGNTTNVYMDGVNFNDDAAMQEAAMGLLYGLRRKAVL